MSVENPTEKQLNALRHLHRQQLAMKPTFGPSGVVASRISVMACLECRQEWPCRTMKALGAKKIE